MYFRALVMFFVAFTLFASPSLAQEEKPILGKKPAVVMIGDRWKVSRTRQKSVDVTIYWDRESSEADMRTPSMDAERSTYRNSPFPLSTNKQAYFDVNAMVTLTAEGKVTECRFDPETPVDAEVGIDPLAIAHICPMLMQHVMFHPALDQYGQRTERKGRVFVSYSMVHINTSKQLIAPPPMMSPVPAGKSSGAFPILGSNNEFSFEDIGLSEQKMKELGKKIIIARLKVDQKGQARNCRLSAATYVDALDNQICAKAMAIPYIPAKNDNGDSIESDYLMMVFSVEIFGQ